MNHAYFITGTGTDVGKTMVSALLALALRANYFKPIQSGTPTDSDFMRLVLGNQRVFPENYRLSAPLSPNQAARIDGVHIDIAPITVEEKIAQGPLIVEGAGGVLTPINETLTMIDLMAQLGLKTIVVASSSLGTISHTMQSINVLQQRHIPLSSIVLFGPQNPRNQQDIQQRTGLKTIAYDDIKHIDWETWECSQNF